MRLKKQTGYAIRILVACARNDQPLIKVAELSEKLEITRQNVFKIVNILSRGGFLAPVRGPAGGVRLARPANEISVGDVVRTMETDRSLNQDSDQDVLSGLTSAAASLLDDAFSAFAAVLDGHTIADLAQAKKMKQENKPARQSSRGC